MECEPSARVEVVKVACALPFNGFVAGVVAPSRKVTVPVGLGVLLPTPATVAVKVIDWPVVAGFAEEVSVVVVLVFELARSATCVRAVEVEAARSWCRRCRPR